jgi:hypothetical protein
MATAGRKSTPIDEKTFGELSEAELNELNERMQRAIQRDIQDHPEHWARARAEAAEHAKASKALRRMMAIEAGLIAPPWADKLIGQLKAPAPKATGTPAWIQAEAARMKAAGELREDLRITDFAKLLWKRLKAAAKADESLRAVDWRHIKNNLPDWGLWPISSSE